MNKTPAAIARQQSMTQRLLKAGESCINENNCSYSLLDWDCLGNILKWYRSKYDTTKNNHRFESVRPLSLQECLQIIESLLADSENDVWIASIAHYDEESGLVGPMILIKSVLFEMLREEETTSLLNLSGPWGLVIDFDVTEHTPNGELYLSITGKGVEQVIANIKSYGELFVEF